MATEYTYSLNEFLKDQLAELPGVIRSVALKELRLTIQEFFEKSYAWTADVTAVAVSTGETGHQIDDGDANTAVIGILDVAMGNATEGFRSLRSLPERPVNEDESSSPDYWFVTSNPDEIKLYPYLDTATSDTLTVKVALMPAADIDPASNTLPRQIFMKYYNAIEYGLLARLYEHPNKPYSAPLLSTKKRHEFVKAIGFYAAQRKNGYNGSPRWNYPRGWK